jgi:fatty acid desaturase
MSKERFEMSEHHPALREPANLTQVRTTDPRPAGEAARHWRANLPEELRQRSLVSGGVLLSAAAVGYVATMVGAVWLPTFLGRTVSLGLAPFMIGALFVIGHDAATTAIHRTRG